MLEQVSGRRSRSRRQRPPQEDLSRETDLTPAMDVFSAGCCLAELFSDGNPPFDFSQLLAFR